MGGSRLFALHFGHQHQNSLWPMSKEHNRNVPPQSQPCFKFMGFHFRRRTSTELRTVVSVAKPPRICWRLHNNRARRTHSQAENRKSPHMQTPSERASRARANTNNTHAAARAKDRSKQEQRKNPYMRAQCFLGSYVCVWGLRELACNYIHGRGRVDKVDIMFCLINSVLSGAVG